MTKLRTFLVVAAVVTVVGPASIASETESFDDAIIVNGEGKATSSPDMATITTGVVTQAESARAALDENNSAMETVVSTLKEGGVAAKDIQTSSFNVNPVYEHSNDGRQQPQVAAYRADNQVQVKIRDLASLGDVLDALVDAGSNQISGVSFGIADPTGILQEARSHAIRDAKRRADVYAQAAGVAVGQVRRISEQPVEPPQPMHFGAEFRTAAASVPIATGEQEYRVTVNVAYELLTLKPGKVDEH